VSGARATVVHLVVTRRYVGYPSGAATVAGALRAAGVDTDLRDYLLHSGDLLDLDNLAAFLADAGDLAWICCGPEAVPLLLLALPRVRERQPRTRFVLGERVPLLPKVAGPSAVAAELLAICPELDAVAVGESDVTAAELGAALPGWAPVAGLVWRDDGGIRSESPRPRADPVPEWATWAVSRDDLQPYRIMYTQDEELYFPIAASRGCVYHCTFCSAAPSWDRRQVRRDVAAVVGEMERLHREAAQNRFSFMDETFVLERGWVVAFCEELHRRKLRLSWRCTGRVNLLDRELLETMAKAGCEGMELGVESGSAPVLERIRKGFDPAAAATVARLAGEIIGDVSCNFIWGFPFETTFDLAESLLLIKELGTTAGVAVRLAFLHPYRPSSLYDEYRDTLRFDRYWHRLAPRHPVMERVLGLVEARPHTFSGFCYLDHPALGEKLGMLQRAGLDGEMTANGFTAALYR
jgi:radical SAM superfamily enzyme YgiQ (UPF0313 family)